jgi:hypothetical protein
MKTKNIKLLLTGSALAVMGALSLQACSSSDDSSGSAGSGGTSSGGTSSGGKGGTSSTAGTSSGGKGGTSTGGTGTGGTGTGGTGGTGTAGTGAEGGDTGNQGGDTGAAGASGEAHPTAAECTNFCTVDEATCTDTNQPYASAAECQTDCLAYPLGDDSDPTRLVAKTGDNFACRAYHLQNAITNMADAAKLKLHCGHTGLVSTACFNP